MNKNKRLYWHCNLNQLSSRLDRQLILLRQLKRTVRIPQFFETENFTINRFTVTHLRFYGYSAYRYKTKNHYAYDITQVWKTCSYCCYEKGPGQLKLIQLLSYLNQYEISVFNFIKFYSIGLRRACRLNAQTPEGRATSTLSRPGNVWQRRAGLRKVVGDG